MNTNRISHIIVGMLVFVLLASTFMSGVNAAVEITEYPKFSTGDYFNYDLNASGMVASMKKTLGPNSTIKLEMSKASMKVTGTDKVTVNGNSYDCIVMTMTMDLKMNISATQSIYGQTHTYAGEMHRIMSQKMWETKSDLKQVKAESITYTYTNASMDGQKTNQDSKQVMETTYSNLVDQYKLPVKVGSKWSTHTTEHMHIMQMRRANAGPWQKQGEFNRTESTTMYYEALSEQNLTVKAGTFDVLKIRSSNESENKTYMDMYMTSSGILVKMDMHSGNTTQFSMELTSYQMASEESGGGSNNGGSTPSIGIIPVIVAVGLAAIAYRRYSKQ